MAKTFQELDAFKLAAEMNDTVWTLRSRIKSESPGTWYQLDRSAGSVSDNIAEGFARESRADFANFLRYSRGSAAEAQAQIARSRRRNLITDVEARKVWEQLRRISMMLKGLRKYLKQKPNTNGGTVREEVIPYGEEYWPTSDQVPFWWHDEAKP